MSISIEKPLLLQTPATNSPSVVVISPFDPKMTPRLALEDTLKSLLIKAEQQLLAAHTYDDALPVVSRLRQLVRGLDYSTHRRSVAIFVSQQIGKICYMDIAVEQQLVIDEPFRIRDLTDYRKRDREYLVMVLDSSQSRTYLGKEHSLKLIKSNTSQAATQNVFLHQMDLGLGSVLKVFPLPVFIVGPASVTDRFGKLTRYAENIAAYLHKDTTDTAECRLQEWLAPELAAWAGVRQRMVAQQIDKANKTGRLIRGLDNVKRSAGSRNNRLLVLPRDISTDSRPFYKEGTIDEIAEKVLANGGEVEIVDNGLLDDLDQIALIRYC